MGAYLTGIRGEYQDRQVPINEEFFSIGRKTGSRLGD